MINEQIKNIKFKYRNIKDKENVFKDFYLPCLKYSNEYYRSDGFWNSSSLISWAESLPTIIKDYKERKIKLLISKNLESSDMVKILELQHNEEEIKKYLRIKTEDIIKEAIEFSHNPIDNTKKMNIFSWLFTHKILEIKIAIPRHVKNADDYHDKFGIFVFSDDNKISFTGSMNESYTSHVRKSETIRVFKSWDNEEERKKIEEELNDFKEDWHGNDNLEVFELSEDTKHKIKERTPEKDPFEEIIIDSFDEDNSEIYDVNTDIYLNPSKQYDFQSKFRKKFIEMRYGILEMATGSGKTKTALSIISDLLNQKKVNKIIIQMDGNDLLEQWYNDEIIPWINSRKNKEKIRILRQTHKFKTIKNDKNNLGMENFINNFNNKKIIDIILIRNYDFANFLKVVSKKDLNETIIIHDEVHDLFANEMASKIKGLHKNFAFRLGLSATAEREHEPERNQLLFDEIGKIIEPTFKLEDGINRGILCEMNHIPLDYSLTSEESSKIQKLVGSRSEKIKDGKWSTADQRRYRQLVAKVRKLAINKIPSLISFLNKNPNVLNRCIIFVNEKQYGKSLYKELLKFSGDINEYYEDGEVKSLEMFANEEINTIITCQSLSQGISINSLKNIIIISAESRIMNIQRVGRVLRKNKNDPTKISNIVDFYDPQKVKQPTHNEYKRFEWLKKLSELKTNKEYAN